MLGTSLTALAGFNNSVLFSQELFGISFVTPYVDALNFLLSRGNFLIITILRAQRFPISGIRQFAIDRDYLTVN